MVSRMVICLVLCEALWIIWVLEQPGASLMAWSQKMRRLYKPRVYARTHTWMGMFGAEIKKPTNLYSNSKAMLRGLHHPSKQISHNPSGDAAGLEPLILSYYVFL